MVAFKLTKSGWRFPASYEDPREVYYALVKDASNVTEEDHLEASNAEGWCELASIGETYHGTGFTIEVKNL